MIHRKVKVAVSALSANIRATSRKEDLATGTDRVKVALMPVAKVKIGCK